MTHVSQFPIPKDVYNEILDELYWVLADVRKPDEMKEFLGDFFTKTERLMLAKRLALAVMVIKKYDIDIVKKVLHVSTGTIYRMKEKLDAGGNGIMASVRRLMKHEAFEQFIIELFQRPHHDRGIHSLVDS